ncbi:MAG TPA: hypothetical protein ENJ23_04845 [Bacteroidetes bacterium]|nr:hypothetical protein [Bacteroidota bacterium]
MPGDNLYLTLDAELQMLAERLMQDVRGGLILEDVQDGGILAMVSKPDYDPALLSGIIRPDVWKSLVENPDDPLYDRCIQSLYPPGSTFKPVLAIAALSEGVIQPSWTAVCTGALRFGRRYFKCWNAKGHGRLDLYHAIEQSCNVYFYQLGLKTGLEAWSKYARLLGFGQKTGVDLPLESSGVVPDKPYFDRRYGKGKWTNGLLLNLAVGQGDLLVTPIQMVRLAATIARKGVMVRPHLFHHSINPTTGKATFFRADSLRIRGVPQAAFDVVREGMRLVVEGDAGTGKAARVPGIHVAGKTGTAQNPHGKDHAWFIGFAPFENPRVAVVVLVENGGSGGAVAAPRAGALLRKYFEKYPAVSGEMIAEKK